MLYKHGFLLVREFDPSTPVAYQSLLSPTPPIFPLVEARGGTFPTAVCARSPSSRNSSSQPRYRCLGLLLASTYSAALSVFASVVHVHHTISLPITGVDDDVMVLNWPGADEEKK